MKYNILLFTCSGTCTHLSCLPVVVPPDSLTVDRTRLYWSSMSDGAVYSVDKHTGHQLVTEVEGVVGELLAFGYNLQPPPGKCDIPVPLPIPVPV